MGKVEVFGTMVVGEGKKMRRRLWGPVSCQDCVFYELYPWCHYYKRRIYDDLRKPEFCKVRSVVVEEDPEVFH